MSALEYLECPPDLRPMMCPPNFVHLNALNNLQPIEMSHHYHYTSTLDDRWTYRDGVCTDLTLGDEQQAGSSWICVGSQMNVSFRFIYYVTS